VLAAAAVTAVVSLITFGVLLDGLQSQGSSVLKARAANDSVTQAGVLERIALDLARGDAGVRAGLPAAQRKLLDLQRDDRDRARAEAVNRELTAYAAAPDEQGLAAVRANLHAFEAAKRAEQMRLRAEGTRLRNRATRIAAGGLVVLLVLIGLLAFGAVRALVGPVNRLQLFARELGAGRFSARLPDTGAPEMAELAEAFNRSAENLQRATDRHLAELDAVFRDSPLGIAFLDLDLRFVRVNDALAQMNRVPADEHLGRSVGEVTGQYDIERALRRVVETGDPMLDVDIALHGRHFQASYFAVRDESGELLAVGKAMIDVTARRQAEAARERLQAATTALAGAVTVGDVARVTIEQTRLALNADMAVVLSFDPERNQLQMIDDHGLSDAARERWNAVTLDDAMPATRAARTMESVFVPDEAALLELFPQLAGTPYPRAGSYAAVPLLAYGAPQGVLSVGFGRRVPFDTDQRTLLNAIAGQAAIALARARLYEREHTVSQTLQASLLPRALPTVPGLDLAGRLESGARGVEVGGDFYDAFAVSGGAWGIAIGDVCGKGVDAAALTALARHTVRAAAHAYDSPAEVLEALNRAVLTESRPGQFLTAVFARLAPRSGGRFELTLACGGHPPPVAIDATGAPRRLECTGTLLGVIDDPRITETTLELNPGDTLLLYTDGLTEAEAPQHTLSPLEVAQLLAEARGATAAQTAARCLSTAITLGGGETRDDIAVLVVQVELAPTRPRGEEHQGNLRHGDNVLR
jgi:serine phosphatase RsbU (regulator of sigma subunit)/PAS domain-containing protein